MGLPLNSVGQTLMIHPAVTGAIYSPNILLHRDEKTKTGGGREAASNPPRPASLGCRANMVHHAPPCMAHSSQSRFQ
jgi:hypothetical protein